MVYNPLVSGQLYTNIQIQVEKIVFLVEHIFKELLKLTKHTPALGPFDFCKV